MNRKEFLKSIPLLGGLVIAAPSIVRAASLPDRRYVGPTAAPAPTPMPSDTRTNDEVWEDYLNDGAVQVKNRVEQHQKNPNYYPSKWVGGADRIGYDRVKKLVAEKGWTFVETIRDGVTTFEVEGLLFRLY